MPNVYRAVIELPLSGSVRMEREEIGKIASLAKVEEEVIKLGGTFEDSIVRKTGARTLAGVTHPKPGEPVAA